MLRGACSGAVIVAGNRKSSSGQSRPRESGMSGSLRKINVVLVQAVEEWPLFADTVDKVGD
jgi:hypothetical protein